MARDWKLDDYGDLDISSGDYEWVEEETEVAQIAETKLLKVYDEDFLDIEAGIDWFGKMYDHNRDAHFKSLLVKSALLQIPEVSDIIKLNMSLDTVTGVQSVTIALDTIYGDEPLKVNE